MSDRDGHEEPREIPTNWDILHPTALDEAEPDRVAADEDPDKAPPVINVLAASWADAVAALAVCTLALVGLNAAGHEGLLNALPWAATLGVVWWLVAAAVLVTIRQGTPGMLLAGFHFSDLVTPGRVITVVATAFVCAVLLGLPGFLPRSPLAVAAARDLETVPVD